MKYHLPVNESIFRVQALLSDFCSTRLELLKQNPHEDAIVDELMPFLRKYFEDYPFNLNHNYDLMHSNNILIKKAAHFLLAELPKSKIPKVVTENAELIEKDILPDVIFHNISNREQNFIIIELKKSKNTSKDDRVMDELKLKAATSGPLDYTYGIFINIKTGDDISEPPFGFKIFQNGGITHEQ